MVRSLAVRVAAVAILAAQAQPLAGLVLCGSPVPAAESCDAMMADGPTAVMAPASGDAASACALMGPCAQPAAALLVPASPAPAAASRPAASPGASALPSSYDRIPTSPPPQV